MNFLRKPNKNNRILYIILLISLFNLMFPQGAITQDDLGEVEQLKITSAILDKYMPDQIDERDIDYKYLPIAGERKARKTFHLTVTAYSSTVDQCDGDPFTTASGERVRDGIIAYNYLPFGTKVRFPDVFPDKVFVVKDRLRAGSSVYLADIWMPSRGEALQWGARILKMEVL
jgi:3D (Asp-Asp-Asp) domain-containing protein